jgi:hypothetical protein
MAAKSREATQSVTYLTSVYIVGELAIPDGDDGGVGYEVELAAYISWVSLPYQVAMMAA